MNNTFSFAYLYQLFPSDLAVAKNDNTLGPDSVVGSLRVSAVSSNVISGPTEMMCWQILIGAQFHTALDEQRREEASQEGRLYELLK